MTAAVDRVQRIHLINADSTTLNQTKPTDSVCESGYMMLMFTPTIAIYYYYSARKLIVIVPSHVDIEGGAELPSTLLH